MYFFDSSSLNLYLIIIFDISMVQLKYENIFHIMLKKYKQITSLFFNYIKNEFLLWLHDL